MLGEPLQVGRVPYHCAKTLGFISGMVGGVFPLLSQFFFLKREFFQ